MLDTIFGLPVHPLIVHATVVMIPLATIAVLLAGVWPRFRRWAGWLPLGLALVAVVLTPLSTQSGESLQERLASSAMIREHAQLAEGLLPWVGGLLLAAVLTTVLWRRSQVPAARADDAVVDGTARRPGTAAAVARPLILTVAAVAIVAAAGTTVQVVRIGHSGAEAAWSQVAGPQAAPPAAGAGDSH